MLSRLVITFLPRSKRLLISWLQSPQFKSINSLVLSFLQYEDLQDLLELTPKKDVLFIIGDWNAKVGSQETPRVTGKFGLGIRNEAGQRLIEFCQENALVITNIESVMPSSHLILCRLLLLLPRIPPSTSIESVMLSSHLILCRPLLLLPPRV